MNADPPPPAASAAADLARRAEEHLFGHILPFWSGPALDAEQGGWMAWLTNDLKPDRAKPKGLILNTRLLWTFAAAYRARPEFRFHDLAERARQWVMERFWDAGHGGAFWQLDDAGRVVDDSKQVYGQAFYIYALAEYHLAFHSPSALARAVELFELLERHTHDPKHGGYFEARPRDWSHSPAAVQVGGAELGAGKSMNTTLHVLEAFTTLYRAWPNPRLAARLRELIRIFRERILDRCTWHFHHYFAADWKALSDNYTFGHDIEGSWLLCEAAEALGDPILLDEVGKTALPMARAVLQEGLAADGGLAYEGKAGRIVDAATEWWPQAEAVVGFVNAWQISREPQFLEAARRVWDFIERYIVDRTHGDWFWRVTPDRHPDPKLPKVSEWKCPYHSARACLETMRRLRNPAIA
jgi:mannobiose 2-epimerase